MFFKTFVTTVRRERVAILCVYMSMFVGVCVCECEYVCVCVWERESEMQNARMLLSENVSVFGLRDSSEERKNEVQFDVSRVAWDVVYQSIQIRSTHFHIKLK